MQKKHTHTYIYTTKNAKKSLVLFSRNSVCFSETKHHRQWLREKPCTKKIHETRCSGGLDVLFVFYVFFFSFIRTQTMLSSILFFSHSYHSPSANSNHIFRLNRVFNSHRRGDTAGGQLALYSPPPMRGAVSFRGVKINQYNKKNYNNKPTLFMYMQHPSPYTHTHTQYINTYNQISITLIFSFRKASVLRCLFKGNNNLT